MRFPRITLALAIFLLAGCKTAPETLPIPVESTEPTTVPVHLLTSTPTPQRAPLLRIAILGDVTTTNVWEMFDEPGANYWNYATQASYWPTLYRLTPPSMEFLPATAQGMPSPLECNSTTCTATVNLQPGLTWTDGSSFTASDVEFTVNTALQFRLGLNWKRHYNPNVLDHAEAVDETTVKFYFIGKPTIVNWHYGALQGPVVNRAYWEPKIADAIDLLPDPVLLVTVHELEQEYADLQVQIEGLYSSLNAMAPASLVYQETNKQATRFQEELNFVANKRDKARTEYETQLTQARTTLFFLDNQDEPTLGAWKFAEKGGDYLENSVNLATPFGNPWFDSIRYIQYPIDLSAAGALERDAVDIVLTPNGLSEPSVNYLKDNAEITLVFNETRSARFLVFNNTNPYLADPALHQALSCMLEPQTLEDSLEGDADFISDFVLDDFWKAEDIALPCAGQASDERLIQAVTILKTAGYSWKQEPTADVEGVGLRNLAQNALPDFTLLVAEDDPVRVKTAIFIADQAKALGLLLNVQQSDPDDLLYAVFGSRGYEMTLLGWRLSAYPAYLCDWFDPGGQNPSAYSGSRLQSECAAWNETSSLDDAREHAIEIQSILAQDLPLIPIYVNLRADAYRNVRFPFENLFDGLSGLYGAPESAIPNP